MTGECLHIRLPAWLREEEDAYLAGTPLRSVEARMDWVIGLARRNVREGMGGPFAAAVFESADGRLVAAGVNVVVAAHCSAAHAEIMALSVAQQRLATHTLWKRRGAGRELVSSAEPCAMCLGAVPWSGVRRLVCAARGTDVEAIGMDEGAKPARWVAALARRGIGVVRDVNRAAAVAVLRAYVRAGGAIYNGAHTA